ncbi:hypothetical protein KAJ27_14650, partial [bacterium]|nr:hypothetical protein [bacterium]
MKILLFILTVVLIGGMSGYTANLEKVTFEDKDQRIFFHFDTDDYILKPVSTAALEILTFNNTSAKTDWAYRTFKNNVYLSYIRIFSGNGFTKIIIGKKKGVVSRSKKIGNIVSLSYYK